MAEVNNPIILLFDRDIAAGGRFLPVSVGPEDGAMNFLIGQQEERIATISHAGLTFVVAYRMSCYYPQITATQILTFW